ncbi:unnamed protein product [Caenorhabditis bovis]|uniref:Tc1-like transposase DDE domain-containing protein n=1 Tax=Caenorhabditis bovis TaxID=2654633 RepID=A0A8S1EBY0_9PELO|nr:unnamed protein product [Caenorhabditis bovis]
MQLKTILLVLLIVKLCLLYTVIYDTVVSLIRFDEPELFDTNDIHMYDVLQLLVSLVLSALSIFLIVLTTLGHSDLRKSYLVFSFSFALCFCFPFYLSGYYLYYFSVGNSTVNPSLVEVFKRVSDFVELSQNSTTMVDDTLIDELRYIRETQLRYCCCGLDGPQDFDVNNTGTFHLDGVLIISGISLTCPSPKFHRIFSSIGMLSCLIHLVVSPFLYGQFELERRTSRSAYIRKWRSDLDKFLHSQQSFTTPTLAKTKSETKPLLKKVSSTTARSNKVKNADLLLARSLKSLTIDDFPFLRTNEDVKNRGEQIVQNLVSALKIIKNRLGDCAKGSIFDNIEVAARALTGISASSIRRRLDEIPETKRPEKRQWISRTSIYKAAGEGISEYKKELIRKRLEYCWKNEELVTVSSLSEWCKNIPTSTSKKKEYCSFLLKNGKVFHPRIKRKELWESVKDVIAMNGGRLRMRKYEIDEWARTEHGVEIVRLPPYHCSLNAIEFVWAQLKNQLKSIGKTTDKLETIIERTRSILENFSPVKAINLLNHVRKHEDAKRQAIIDGTIVSNDESDDTEDGDDELDYNDE